MSCAVSRLHLKEVNVSRRGFHRRGDLSGVKPGRINTDCILRSPSGNPYCVATGFSLRGFGGRDETPTFGHCLPFKEANRQILRGI